MFILLSSAQGGESCMHERPPEDKAGMVPVGEKDAWIPSMRIHMTPQYLQGPFCSPIFPLCLELQILTLAIVINTKYGDLYLHLKYYCFKKVTFKFFWSIFSFFLPHRGFINRISKSHRAASILDYFSFVLHPRKIWKSWKITVMRAHTMKSNIYTREHTFPKVRAPFFSPWSLKKVCVGSYFLRVFHWGMSYLFHLEVYLGIHLKGIISVIKVNTSFLSLFLVFKFLSKELEENAGRWVAK